MNTKYTIEDIAALIATRSSRNKEVVEVFLQTLFSTIASNVLSEEVVKVKGLGTFKLITVEARESINVNTNERITIPAHYKFSFTPDKELSEQVNKPFSCFETTELSDKVTDEELGIIELSDYEETEAEDEESYEDIAIDVPSPTLLVEEETTATSEELTDDEVEEMVDTEDNEAPEETTPDDIATEAAEVASAIEEETEAANEEQPLEDTPAEEELSVEQPTEALIVEDSQVEDSLSNENEFANNEIIAEHKPTEQTEDNKLLSRSRKLIIFFVIVLIAQAALNVFLFLKPKLIGYIQTDTVVVQKVETIVVKEPLMADTTTIHSVQVQQTVSKETAKGKTLPTTYKITPGTRLAMIAKEYYGNKVFWVYIYEHNRAKISDPNNVPIGTELELPAPEQYFINAADTASVEKAKRKQTEIINNMNNAK